MVYCTAYKEQKVKVYTYNNHILKATKIQLDNSYLIKITLKKIR